jgi:hypothetical protein
MFNSFLVAQLRYNPATCGLIREEQITARNLKRYLYLKEGPRRLQQGTVASDQRLLRDLRRKGDLSPETKDEKLTLMLSNKSFFYPYLVTLYEDDMLPLSLRSFNIHFMKHVMLC